MSTATKARIPSLEDLRGSPTDKEVLARRKGWVKEIGELTSEHEKTLLVLTTTTATAAERAEATKAAHDKALVEHRVAAGQKSAANLRFSRSRDLLEGQLLETAAPEIDTFVAELQAESSRLQISGHPSTVGDRQTRASALRDARLRAEELKLQALTPAELAERLDAIREGIDDEVVA